MPECHQKSPHQQLCEGVDQPSWSCSSRDFLRKIRIIGQIKETVDHNRGANALFDSADVVFLKVISTIGGARTLSNVITVWVD